MVILRGGKRDQVALKNMLFLYLNASEVQVVSMKAQHVMCMYVCMCYYISNCIMFLYYYYDRQK